MKPVGISIDGRHVSLELEAEPTVSFAGGEVCVVLGGDAGPMSPIRRCPPQGDAAIGPQRLGWLAEADALFTFIRDVEESYDVIIGNYLAYEQLVMSLAARQMLQAEASTAEFLEARRDCHRALANVLTAATAFRDKSLSGLSALSGENSEDLASHRRALSAAYERWLGYRFMESLRNHAQHHGVCVSGVAIRRTAAPEMGLLVRVEPYIELAMLRASPKFKKRLLPELAPLADGPQGVIGLTALVREYIAGLSIAMGALRQRFKAREDAAMLNFAKLNAHYTGHLGYNTEMGLMIARQGAAPAPDHLYFSTGALIYAHRLREANQDLSHLPTTRIDH